MKTIFSLFLFSISIVCNSQTLTGHIVDQSSNEPLIGATILSHNGNAVSDIDGSFSLDFNSLPDTIHVSYIGYKNKDIIITSIDNEIFEILLENMVLLETMTVTASKYEKRLSESTVSVEVLKSHIISNTNTINIDDALDKVSGVQMVDGQANIRGGSGYSYGAGSRVMLLIDDMPALQTDAGFPNWGDIPVENIDQVEIVKGASSALYGSSALNGIINIRTGTPTAIPQTKFSASYGVFDNPKDIEKKWWGDTTRYETTISLVHKQKFNRLDFVGAIFHNKLESYNKVTYKNRFRGSIKLKYRLTDKTFLGLNTLINKGKNGDFFLWENGNSGALYPIPDGNATHDVIRYFIDPSLVVEDNYGNTHRINTRYHNIKNNNSGNQSNQSVTHFGEYQFQRMLEPINTLITTGLVASNTDTDAELFGDTTFNTRVFAYYGQLEKKLFDKLNLSAGIRYEYNEQNTPEEFNGIVVPGGQIKAGRWIARAGASYEYMPYSSVRASWGQGYRFPTITERFITTSFGIFQIRSNPDLMPEAGWTAELGVKQGLKIGNFKGFVDLVGFTSRYQNMMEFAFGFTGSTASFTSQNVGDTKINGFEISLLGEYNVGKVKISGFGGYTYIDPTYTNFHNEDGELNDSLVNSLSANVNVLKYRSKHNAKFDIQVDYKNFSIGAAFNRSSHVTNIDAVLEGRGFEFLDNPDFLGIKAYRSENNNGYSRFDTRISYKWKSLKASFIINNITNEEYTVRPATIEAPRTFALRLDYVIDWKTSSI